MSIFSIIDVFTVPFSRIQASNRINKLNVLIDWLIDFLLKHWRKRKTSFVFNNATSFCCETQLNKLQHATIFIQCECRPQNRFWIIEKASHELCRQCKNHPNTHYFGLNFKFFFFNLKFTFIPKCINRGERMQIEGRTILQRCVFYRSQ